jgi:hypothetical protein
MSEEVRGRCVDPFFSTKGERGTGLGLAMVYGMAERHGAELEIDSELGAGTVVRLVFPVAQASEAGRRRCDQEHCAEAAALRGASPDQRRVKADFNTSA